MSGRSTPLVSGDDQEPKRKKIRKGTTSCWECKRRKIRCQLRFPSDEICIGCQRRGIECQSQEHPEHPSQGGSRSIVRIEERLERLETLLEKVIVNTASSPQIRGRRASYSSQSQTAADDAVDYNSLAPYSIDTPNRNAELLLYSAVINDTTTTASAPTPETVQSVSSTGQPNFKSISRKLHELFPSQRDADLIVATGATSLFLQIFSLPHGDIAGGKAKPSSSISALPTPSSHPVLLVRTLLYLAIGIQQLRPSKFDVKQLTSLTSSPWEAMAQYLDSASNFISGNDRYMDSLEALECYMLEGYYHLNTSNLRRAWLLFRRAIGLGQLMGLHRGHTEAVKVLDPRNEAHALFMWYRVVYADRYIALLLGLPASHTQDNMIASDELLRILTPIDKLERVHCVISGRIIERNENMMDDGFAATQNIDSCLQKAAKSMPAKWWLLSYTGEDAAAVKTLEDPMRIIVQLMHFNLLVVLHLPYMIRVSPERRFDYSKIACINNSRELLARFIRLRSFSQVTFCSRSINFSAFTGCLTLLLAHLDSHRNNGMDDFLAHQRDSDRDTVEEAIELLLLDDRPSMDLLAQQTGAILKCLLAIEAEASNDDARTQTETETAGRGLRLTIPYFGTVNISRNGIIKSSEIIHSEDSPRPSGANTPGNSACDISSTAGHSSIFLKGQSSYISPPATTAASNFPQTQYPPIQQVSWDHPPNVPSIGLQTDFFPNIQHYPVGLNAEVQDWALQGVDRAFFENLLRGDNL